MTRRLRYTALAAADLQAIFDDVAERTGSVGGRDLHRRLLRFLGQETDP